VARGPHVAPVEHLARRTALGPAADDAERAEGPERRERGVLDRGAREDEPFVLARLGDHGEPGAEASPRRAAGPVTVREQHLPRVDRLSADNRPGELGPTRP